MTHRPNFHRHPRLAVAVILAAVLVGPAAVGGRAADVRPENPEARNPLDQPIGLVWSKAPLRESLENLANTQNVAIWLDRRIDPGRRISLVARDEPLADVLSRLAIDQNLGVCRFQSVVYLGPPAPTARLRTLGALRRREAESLPPDAARRLLRAAPLHWENLANPRELLDSLASENRLRIEGLDLVVHDLWPAFDAPPLDLVDRLTLILAPLGLTFQVDRDGDTLRLVPIPEHVALRRTYPAWPRPNQIARQWREIIPESRVVVEGDRIVVEGRLEDHERLADARRPAEAAPAEPKKHAGAKIDQLRIQRVKFADQPLEPIVRRLATQLNLELRFDADALRRSGIDLDRRVTVELENVTVDELFRTVLEPAGLTFRREGSTLEIRAARP